METFFVNLITNLGVPAGVVVFVLYKILRGDLIPAKTYKDTIGQYKQDTEDWKAAFWKMQEVSETQAKATDRLVSQGETTIKLAKAIPTIEDLNTNSYHFAEKTEDENNV